MDASAIDHGSRGSVAASNRSNSSASVGCSPGEQRPRLAARTERTANADWPSSLRSSSVTAPSRLARRSPASLSTSGTAAPEAVRRLRVRLAGPGRACGTCRGSGEFGTGRSAPGWLPGRPFASSSRGRRGPARSVGQWPSDRGRAGRIAGRARHPTPTRAPRGRRLVCGNARLSPRRS